MAEHTCTYSIGDMSPDRRLAAILLAGNAFGTILMEVRFRELVTTSEDMLTAIGEESVKDQQGGEWQCRHSERERVGRGRTNIYSDL